jgi:putative redox protein
MEAVADVRVTYKGGRTLFHSHNAQLSRRARRVILAARGGLRLMDNGEARAVIHSAGDGLFIGITSSGHAQVIETDKERASAATPMEMLLLALGGCTAVDVVSILKKKREQVTSYRVEVSGTRRDEHPRAYTRMEVRHIVSGRGVSERAVAQAVELSETKYCSVAATLRPGVEIVTTYEIIEEEG